MKQYIITSNDADQRFDKFLKKLFPSASLGYIYKLLRKGNIKVISLEWEKKKRTKDYKLQEWEKVQVFLNNKDIATLVQGPNNWNRLIQGKQKLDKKDILFEDDFLLVVNKAPGLNVHPADHKSNEVSLIEQAHDYYEWELNSLTFKPSLIHRIDRDTSGIIMIAKSKKTLTQLGDTFKRHEAIKKTYFCLVLGKMSRKSGTITKKLLRIENARNENKVQVSEKWWEAITHYKVVDEYSIKLPQWKQILSALEVQIETWRMHQIRVHMATLWNSIIWDKNYGNKKLNSYFAKHFWIHRHMLHAWKIGFYHSQIHKKMNLEAKFKKDMMEFISKIKK